MNPTAEWSGRRVGQARAIVSAWLPAPCGQCGVTVHQDDDGGWVVGHKVARSIDPSLTWVVSNWQPEHRKCSNESGQAAVIAKARLEGRQSALRDDLAAGDSFFSEDDNPRQPPHLPFSPSGAIRAASDPSAPLETRPELAWSPDVLRATPWLEDFADVPADASPPLWMSPPHPEAVGSYGADAVAWVEKVERKTLRWWQRLAITRQLEHREDGSLCWPNVLESASRRSGKSVRIRGMALWRMALGPLLFGERQEIVHTGSDIAVCRKAQKEAWRWCLSQDWTVTKGNGKEAIETPDGDVWLVRAQDATYGWDTTLALVDESWDVKPDAISEGLEPSLLERASAQLHMTSTAHRRARSTMRVRLIDALTRDDGETLVIVWAAPASADVSDPEVWRAASPHWTDARRKMIAAKYEKALAGEVDPEADDPDPMAGFTAQYLNQWPLRARRVVHGDPLTTEDDWAALSALVDPDETPAAAAIESWFDRGYTLSLAYRVEDAALVSASDHPDLRSAVAALTASGYRGQVIVGKSLMADPALRRVRRIPSAAQTTASASELARLMADGELLHDGGEHLTGQVLEVHTQPGADGPRLTSRGRADAVKASAWAATAARKRRPVEFTGIVTATGVVQN